MKITQSLTSSEVRLLIQKSSDGCFIHSLLCLFTHLICTNLYLTFCWRTGAVSAWLRSFPPYCKGIGRTYACIPAFLAFLPVQLVSTVLQRNRPYIRMYPRLPGVPSRSGHYIALNRAPCAIPGVLISYPLYTASMASKCQPHLPIHPTTSLPLGILIFVSCVSISALQI